MEPTKRKTKHKPENIKVGEQVLDLVISYIHNVEDRNSVSLVSRKFYEIDGITRKHLTVHTHYYPNPASLSKRFPFIESLTIRGLPLGFNQTHHRITPWIQQLALEFRCLKELHIRDLFVHDENLEKLARTRGKDLRSLKIKKCTGFSTNGLRHVSKHCNQLRTFCLAYCYHINMKDGIWLHQLALNSTVLERLQFNYTDTDIYNAEDLTLVAKNCCNSLKSLEIGVCLSKLGDAFRYAVRLEHFGGYIRDVESEHVGFQFPPNMRSLSLADFPVTRYSIVLPFLNQIRKLKLVSLKVDEDRHCLLFKRCPNLEVLYIEDVCGDKGLQVIGECCKKLRKLNGVVTNMGLIAVAKGCSNLESLKLSLTDISNEALECVGTHLKNLRDFRIWLSRRVGITILPLDNGVRAMLMGCSKLEKLHISLLDKGLTDVGLEYIGKYGANLRFLSLYHTGNLSYAGLVKLSEGCPRLRKLKLSDCPFSKQAVASSVFNIPSLRYFWGDNGYFPRFALTRPDFEL